MKIDMAAVAECTVCAGAHAGHTALLKMLGMLGRHAGQPETVLLDFQGVEVATASFLRESVLSFRDMIRLQNTSYYPMVINANGTVKDEIKTLLELKGGALLAGEADDDENVSAMEILGRLEGKQQLAYDLVVARGETDAAELQAAYGDSEGVKQTAWNNRLSALASQGLLVETSNGRAKRYRPVFEGVDDGR